ncbi:MAG TPA: hypothetical protein VLH75_12230 [Longimicrobiales bacterium]|nr:hypothetical protein [Longimicrobiales bacterium]
METKGLGPPKNLWAYAYEIVPPKTADHMKVIEEFLEEEHAQAKHTARTWRGQLVCEQQVTHILVVADTPDQGGEVNRRLERRLKAMRAGFSRTIPMPVSDNDPAPAAPRP